MNVVLEFIVGVFVIIYCVLESWVLFFVPRRWRYKSIAGQTALVTGGGSGMGRLLCLELAKRGCRVVTWDINEEGNAETVRLAKALLREQQMSLAEKKLTDISPGKKNGEQWRPMSANNVDDWVFGFKVDLCNRDDVYRVAELVKKQVGTVDILVNNAGVVSGKKFLSTSDQQNMLTMNVNSICHFWTVKAFLPGMLEQNRGHIVTLASLAGITGVNQLVDYCASKFAAVGFDEALRNELKASGSEVKTTCVCPYYVATGMFEGVRSKILPILQPDYVVQEIIAAILTNKPFLILPSLGYFLVFLKSFLPFRAIGHIEHFMGVKETMVDFKGRSTGPMARQHSQHRRDHYGQLLRRKGGAGEGGGADGRGVIGGLRSSASSISLALPAATASVKVLAFGAFSLVFFVGMSAVFKSVNFFLRFIRFFVPKRFLPVNGYDKVHEIMRISATMSDFKGRNTPPPLSPAAPAGNGNLGRQPQAPPKQENHNGTGGVRNGGGLLSAVPTPTNNNVSSPKKPAVGKVDADGDDDGLLSSETAVPASIPESKLLRTSDDGGGLKHQELVVTIAEE